MRKKPKRSSLPHGDIATVRAALRVFAHEGSRPIGDDDIDEMIHEIARFALNPNNIGPLAIEATRLLKDVSDSALMCSNSLKSLDYNIKRIIAFDESLDDNDLDVSFEPLATYSDIDGIEENELRTESTLLAFLIDRLQLLSIKANRHIGRLNSKYSHIGDVYKRNGQSAAKIIVFHSYRIIYRIYGFDGIRAIKKTPPSPKRHNLSDFYRLVLTIYNFTFKTNYDPFKGRDIFISAITDLITDDEEAVRRIFSA